MSATVEGGVVKIKYSIEVTTEDQQWIDEANKTLNDLEQVSAQSLIGSTGAGFVGGVAAQAMNTEQAVQDAINQEIEASVTDAIDDAVGGKGPSVFSRLNRNLLADEARTAQQIASVSRSGIEAEMLGLAKSIPFIAAIAGSPALIKFIVEELTKPGGLLDRRFRLIVEEVINNQRSRDHNWAVQIGNKQLILVSYPVGTGPGHVMNNLEKIRNNPGRVLSHGIDMKAEGDKRT